jgi:CMP-N-acetylneuraminic acid synthetase
MTGSHCPNASQFFNQLLTMGIDKNPLTILRKQLDKNMAILTFCTQQADSVMSACNQQACNCFEKIKSYALNNAR